MAAITASYAVRMRRSQTYARRWIAHRGGGDAAPENTLAAFRTGYAAGFRAFECDVRLSADGVPYLLHDNTLVRTTDARGTAARWPWGELRQLDAGAWYGPRFEGEPLPRLDDVLAFADNHRAWLNLELKPAHGMARTTGARVAERIAAWLARHPRTPAPLLSSFSPTALRAAHEVLHSVQARVPSALLSDTCTPRLMQRAQSLGAVALHLHWRGLTPACVDAAHAAGFAVRAYTVNSAATARRLLDWGIDGLFTDRLDLPQCCLGDD